MQRDRLQLLVPCPVVAQRLHQFLHRADLLVEYQVFHRQQRVHRGGVSDAFNGDEVQLRTALVDILAAFRAAFDQAGDVRCLKILCADLLGAFVGLNGFFDDVARLAQRRHSRTAPNW